MEDQDFERTSNGNGNGLAEEFSGGNTVNRVPGADVSTTRNGKDVCTNGHEEEITNGVRKTDINTTTNETTFYSLCSSSNLCIGEVTGDEKRSWSRRNTPTTAACRATPSYANSTEEAITITTHKTPQTHPLPNRLWGYETSATMTEEFRIEELVENAIESKKTRARISMIIRKPPVPDLMNPPRWIVRPLTLRERMSSKEDLYRLSRDTPCWDDDDLESSCVGGCGG